ncbi:bifunctional methylenetetrahydrofolate dehydrogenase/methenyltetrahydrofolate cyclohydrolase [Candidatus Parcubacteria bacterium]|nr:MAG: bifunctional methylenetetrahydrofolate dehydrogenase/methenyltetrahydrofolate cyclohydrolase [Candidatus Parcubacteria bacterium]
MDKMIDGRKLADEIKKEIKQEIREKKLRPNLAVVLVGEDPASKLYVNLKKKACQEVGINFHEYLLAENSSEKQILDVIDFLNKDEQIDAILVQLPLPKHIDTDKIISTMDPKKDVDGFHQINIKNFLENQSSFVPGLALGIFKLINSTEEKLENKKATIIAKSNILYQPLAKLLNDQGVSTTIVHPGDKDMTDRCKEADVLISAWGKAFAVGTELVKDEAIVIDVGTNQVGDYTVGDVDYSSVFSKTKYITPVPGGVGPMTVAMLLYNTVKLAETK